MIPEHNTKDKYTIASNSKGIIPWEKPYSLLNQMILKHEGEYASFKQWTELGGHIRKGEKSEIVVFWKIQPIEEETESIEKIIKQIPFLRYFNEAYYSPSRDLIHLPLLEQFNNFLH